MTNLGFFAVGQDSILRACALGMNAAIAFLVMARGSGPDNVTTAWSANAIADRAGMRWRSADAAIDQLLSARVISRKQGATKTRPLYKLAKTGELIWIPNAVVDGASDEVPPVIRLRQTQDVMVVRLFVELYQNQNLREDGGVSPEIVRSDYERHRAGQRGGYVVWSFTETGYSVTWQQATRPHRRETLTQEEKDAGSNEGIDFFRRFGLLLALGLVEWVPYLYDGPEGEPIHPLHGNSDIREERDLYVACANAAERCLTPGQWDYTIERGGTLAVVPAHITEVRLIGVARLRYRPHTLLTGAWWADALGSARRHIERYEAIASDKDSARVAP